MRPDGDGDVFFFLCFSDFVSLVFFSIVRSFVAILVFLFCFHRPFFFFFFSFL